MSKRQDIAKKMEASKRIPSLTAGNWLNIIYHLEAEGFQVVKTEETAEYQGLRVADDATDEDATWDCSCSVVNLREDSECRLCGKGKPV